MQNWPTDDGHVFYGNSIVSCCIANWLPLTVGIDALLPTTRRQQGDVHLLPGSTVSGWVDRRAGNTPLSSRNQAKDVERWALKLGSIERQKASKNMFGISNYYY